MGVRMQTAHPMSRTRETLGRAKAGPDPDRPPGRSDFLQNQGRLEGFYRLQRSFVTRLAACPALVRAWLEALPPREENTEESENGSKTWRAERLSLGRRRELASLIAGAEASGEGTAPLAEFLLTMLPVSIYFAIGACARPDLRTVDTQADELIRRIADLREQLFQANYGLAKSVVRGKKEYEELVSVASSGLLAAIDRYVPGGEKGAKFGYWATLWMKHEVRRHGQKHNGIVALSINQQRIVQRIDRHLEERSAMGLPEPGEAEVCAELGISPDAYYWYRQRPTLVPLESILPTEDEHGGEKKGDFDELLAASAPEPDEVLEDQEVATYLRELLRERLDPARRIMLSYARAIGSLTDASEDYLRSIEIQGIDGIQSHAASGRTAGVPYSRIVFIREDGADGIANRQPTVGSAGAPV